MLPTDLFLALRYLRPKRTFVSAITLLSILGPLLGVAVLLIVMSIMDGFQEEIKKGIMNIQAHLQIYPAYERFIPQPEEAISLLKKQGIPAAPMIEGTALLQLKNGIAPKVVNGIQPELEQSISSVKEAIIDGKYELEDGEALIGDSLAQQFGLQLGDSFLIHSPARLTQNVQWNEDGTVEIKKTDEVYLPESLKVAGIFSLGIEDFDSNIIYISLDQAAELFGLEWGSATTIHGRVPDPMNMDDITAVVRAQFPEMQVITWQERNKMLFSTLRVEKNLMTFLLAFIVLVASFSIATTLITVVVQKTREVGILMAVGFSRWTIARVFLFQGIIIGVIGTFLGTIAGLAILHWRDAIAKFLSWIMGHDVFPAELYHLRQIPSLTTMQDLLFTVVLSLVICVLASVIPALYASHLSPAKALQEEA